MKTGSVAYRDVWDHKPPVVYIINLIALNIGDGSVDSVHLVERVFAATGVVLLFWLVFWVFGRQLPAFICTLFFLLHFYHPKIFDGGNLTEEYGAVMLIGGIMCAFAARKLAGKTSVLMAVFSGLILMLTILIKEPFLFSAVPWFIYVGWPKDGQWKKGLSRLAWMIAGAIIPLAAFVIYLLTNSAMKDWIEVLSYNIAYSDGTRAGEKFMDILEGLKMAHKKMIKYTIFIDVAAIVGIIGMFSRRFRAKYKSFYLAVFFCAVLSLMATFVATRYSGHYYLQLIPCYILLSAFGVVFVQEVLPQKKTWQLISAVCLLLLVFFLDGSEFKIYHKRLKSSSRPARFSMLTKYIQDNSKPDDKIWIPSLGFTHLYMTTGRASPTKWIYILNHLFIDTWSSTRQEKLDLLRDEIKSDPPRLILVDSRLSHFLKRNGQNGLLDWIKANYKIALKSENSALQMLVYTKAKDEAAYD